MYYFHRLATALSEVVHSSFRLASLVPRAQTSDFIAREPFIGLTISSSFDHKGKPVRPFKWEMGLPTFPGYSRYLIFAGNLE